MLPKEYDYKKDSDKCCAVCEFCDCLFYPIGDDRYRIVYRCRLFAEEVDSFKTCLQYSFNETLPK